ncbi:AAA family ATPase [Deinococcus sp. AJ005]|uniref:BCS1 and AAA domain-containing protein n=1 Tax=Deinococcus sp. AJ005 TaxID=2652443 RepID=UPI00125CD25F|nr:AAA family ATPase [Deinococcus sp. AJ005]QFP75451.1 AAA family ATPase [Deinococcus sp. AJ005]
MNINELSNILHTFWTELLSTVQHTLATNELAQGGLLIGLLSAAAMYARTLPTQLLSRLDRRFTVTLDIQGDDPAFPWLAAWLAAQPVGRNLRHLGVVTRFNEQMGGHNVAIGTDRDGDEITARLVPLSGAALLRFHGHWMLAYPQRTERQGANQGGLGFTHSLTFRMLSGARPVITELLREAYDFTAGRSDGRVEIYVPEYHGWKLVERRAARPLESLIYAEGLLDNLHADLGGFFGDREWYAGMGIPYRRGYLLHGPPGNGKSSLVSALAGAFGLNVCVLNLATPDLSDDRLTALLAELPRRALLLLEDIDAVFLGREPRTPSVKLSFNGLLNALDGVAAGEGGRVTFMTTNDLAGLDAALIRPGRADRHLLIDNATHAQVAGMLRRFWPEWNEAEIGELAARLPEGMLSMARIQEYLLERRADEAGVRRDWADLAGMEEVVAPCPTRLRLLAG